MKWNEKKKKNQNFNQSNRVLSASVIVTFVYVSMHLECCLDLLSSNMSECRILNYWLLRSNWYRSCWRKTIADPVASIYSKDFAHFDWRNTIGHSWNSRWRHKIDESFGTLATFCLFIQSKRNATNEKNERKKKTDNSPKKDTLALIRIRVT